MDSIPTPILDLIIEYVSSGDHAAKPFLELIAFENKHFNVVKELLDDKRLDTFSIPENIKLLFKNGLTIKPPE